MSITPRLDDVLKPGQPLPPDEMMIAKALEILSYSPHGQQLSNFAEQSGIHIGIMATPKPVTYLPEPKKAFIGFNRNKPPSPSAFVLMMAGLLREAMQESHGITHPHLTAPMDEHLKVSMAKHEDKLWYMCTVAWELNTLELFTEYNFLDALRKMGHDEALEAYLRHENKRA